MRGARSLLGRATVAVVLTVAATACDRRAPDPLHSRDPLVRKQAVTALADARDRGAALRKLIVALQDPDAWVRQAAIGALGRLDHPDAVPVLVSIAADRRATDAHGEQRRVAALVALEERRDPAAIEPLVALLREEPDGIIEVGLGRVVPPFGLAAIPPVVALLRDPSMAVRLRALSLLEAIVERTPVDDGLRRALEPLRADPVAGALVLRVLGPPATPPPSP